MAPLYTGHRRPCARPVWRGHGERFAQPAGRRPRKRPARLAAAATGTQRPPPRNQGLSMPRLLDGERKKFGQKCMGIMEKQNQAGHRCKACPDDAGSLILARWARHRERPLSRCSLCCRNQPVVTGSLGIERGRSWHRWGARGPNAARVSSRPSLTSSNRSASSPLTAFNAQAKTSRCKRKRAPKAAKCPGRLASEAFNDAGLRWRTGSAGGPPCPLAGPHLHPPRNLRMRAACLPRSFARQSGLLPSWTPMPSIAWCDGAEQGALAVDALFWAFASPNPRAGGDRAAPFAVIA